MTLVDIHRRQVQQDPFLYLSQYEQAEYAVFARLADLPDWLGRSEGEGITFIFSIGRCGSTLAVNLARAAGLLAYSECDALLGMPSYQSAGKPPMVENLLRRIVGSLAAYEPRARIVIKMRAQSNRDVLWFTTAFPRARFVFLLRSLAPWVASYVQVFNWSSEQMLNSLREAAKAQCHLAESGRLAGCIRYEDLVARPAEAIVRMFGKKAERAAPIDVTRVLQRNSQLDLLPKRRELANQVEPRLRELCGKLAEEPELRDFVASQGIADLPDVDPARH